MLSRRAMLVSSVGGGGSSPSNSQGTICPCTWSGQDVFILYYPLAKGPLAKGPLAKGPLAKGPLAAGLARRSTG